MNFTLKLKRLFLSFAQAYFANEPTSFIWNTDPKVTGIFIGDKYSGRGGTAEKYPAIILASFNLRWGRTAIDQLMQYPDFAVNPVNKVRSDLVLGSLVFQCLAQSGPQAEMISDTLFNAIIGFKDQFRKNGIHQILDVQEGDVQLIRTDSVKDRLYSVPISISFAVQSTIATGADEYNLVVFSVADNAIFLQSLSGVQNPDGIYMYSVSGTQITFNIPPPSGLQLQANYVSAGSLLSITDNLGVADGSSLIYYLTYEPYSYVEPLNVLNFIFTVS
jgi:hypothetical protein